jgi:hypothetical protein
MQKPDAVGRLHEVAQPLHDRGHLILAGELPPKRRHLGELLEPDHVDAGRHLRLGQPQQ